MLIFKYFLSCLREEDEMKKVLEKTRGPMIIPIRRLLVA